MQDDKYYSEWLEKQEQVFMEFHPENIDNNVISGNFHITNYSTESLEPLRVRKYEECYGIFLVHDWRPSRTKGQIADIVIRLQQHGSGPISDGIIDNVEYILGPNFFSVPVIKNNAKQDFRLEVSAYGSFLCLAKIHFKDKRDPILIERYINFEAV